MRFRLGFIIGGAVGYYFGAKAGHERYRQLNNALEKAKSSGAYETATEKAKAVVDLGRERAKDFVEEHKPGDSGSRNGFADTPDPSPSGLS
ncbi:MAG TPA: YtxH domain-containing protein [Acidimicrobiales bacterium]|nr:YtxH domain-containing protein [Acidimicrobiales bacterium]